MANEHPDEAGLKGLAFKKFRNPAVDEESTERFAFQPGPIFANIVLADDVIRAH